VKKREKTKVLCVHDDHVGYMYKFMQWGIA
jgi:hypothetical protein